ncbi:MAG: hypothetical protein AAF485_10105 [Chloroflexota bacterium]
MTVTNRETIRDGVATLLTTALVGDGKPVQQVYNHKSGDFAGQSPVVLVTSSGTDRSRVGTYTTFEPAFDLSLMIFVLYSDPDNGWSEADAEDRLDLVEASVAEVVQNNYSNPGLWDRLVYAGPSQVLEATVGGDEYLLEIVPLTAEKEDD